MRTMSKHCFRSWASGQSEEDKWTEPKVISYLVKMFYGSSSQNILTIGKQGGHARPLIDEQKCTQTAHRYTPITGKFVLYRGESKEIEGIQYQNVEEYLRTLVS